MSLKNLLKSSTEMRSYQIIRTKWTSALILFECSIFYHFRVALSHLVVDARKVTELLLAMEKFSRELIAGVTLGNAEKFGGQRGCFAIA